MSSSPNRKKLAIGFVVRFLLFAIFTYVKNYFLHYEWSMEKKIVDSIMVGLVVATTIFLFYVVLIALSKKAKDKKIIEQVP